MNRVTLGVSGLVLGVAVTAGCSGTSAPPAVATGGNLGIGGANPTGTGGTATQSGGQQSANGGTASSSGGAVTTTTQTNGGTGTGGTGTISTSGGNNSGGNSSGGNSSGGNNSGGANVGGNSNRGGTQAKGGSNSGGANMGGANMGGANMGGANVGGANMGGANMGGATGGGASAWKGAVCTTMGTTPIATAWNTGYGAWKDAHVVLCGGNMARVKGCQGENSTCSEGVGYGMLLVVAAGDQALFDKMNAFRKGLQAVNNAPDTSSGKLMAWLSGDTCPPSASGGNSNSATDGDLDAAMALVQAEKRWPGGAYLTEAKQYIEAIWLNQVEKDGSGNPTRLKPGNLALANDSRDYISYYAPGYFHVFAQITGQAKWTKLADAFYTKLAAQQASCTNGQVPDTFGATDCRIWYDSCRAPWRIAADYGWFSDPRAKAFLDTLRSGSVSSSTPGSASDQKNSAIIGAFAMSGMSSDNVTMQKMCDNWESTQKDDNPYFQKTLRLLFMHLAGGLTDSGI